MAHDTVIFNRPLAEDMNSDFDQMDSRRRPYEDYWREKAMYVSPGRSFELGDETEGSPIASNVKSQAPIEALETWKNGFQGQMTSKHYPWFRYAFDDESLFEVQGARQWLQALERQTYFHLNRSNFYPQMAMVYEDGGWCGTASMSSAWDPVTERLVFQAWHPYQIWIEVDQWGQVNKVIRLFRESAVNLIERRFPDQADRLSRDIWNAYESGNAYELFDIWHCVGEREDRIEGLRSSVNKPWYSVYMEPGKEGIISESGFDTFSYHTWRPYLRSLELYGRGPADKVWPSIMKINGLEEDLSLVSQKMADPAMMVPGKWKGKFTTHPGYVLYYSQDPRIRNYPLQENIRYDIPETERQRTEDDVMRGFHAHTFAMIANMQVADLKNVTATGFNELRNERTILMGPLVGNIEDTLLDPVIDRVFGLLAENGKMPPAPPELVRKAGGAQINVVYHGPLAQIQREYFEQRAIRATIRDTLPIFNLHPGGIDVYKFDEMLRRIGRGHNIDEDLIRDAVEFEQQRGIREQRVQAQQQMAVAEQAAGTYKDAAVEPGPGSPAAAILGAA